MINNRQQNGRRRGRGNNNQRPQGGNTGGGGNRSQDNGNRIDNRSRGNAAQLLEKYKTLARDSQQAGDRVLTEYYNQFADHYFRVLADTRARYEENQPRREGRYEGDEQDYDADDNFGGEPGDEEDNSPQAQRREARPARDDDRNGQRYDRPNGQNPSADSEERGQSADRGQDNRERQQRPRNDFNGSSTPRRDRGAEVNGGARPERNDDRQPESTVREDRPVRQPRPPREADDSASLGFVLPPAINAAAEAPSSEAEAPKRRGRPRKVAPEAAIEG